MDTGRLVAGRYRLGAALGSGGMATVHGAVDESLGRSVAVKLFHADLANAGDERRQAEEVSLLAGLNHPALVTLFDAGRDSSDAFIVMELVEGEDLRERLAAGPLDPGSAAGIGADLASALAYIHGRGVVHRDVKPANVLLPEHRDTGTPRAKLADFGIARLIDSTRLTATGAVIGTASFLSPEQARGEEVSAPSDVYSLSLVLLEALTGQRAFPGTAVESTVARLTRDPAIPAALGPAWAALLKEGTAREPGARPGAEEFAARLLSIRDAAGTTAVQLRPPEHVTATEPMSTEFMPTQAMDPADVETEPLSASGAPGPRRPAPDAPRRLSRRALLIVAAAAAAVAVVVGIGAVLPPGGPESPTEAEPVQYPAVEGTLGDHLAELQRSVEP